MPLLYQFYSRFEINFRFLVYMLIEIERDFMTSHKTYWMVVFILITSGSWVVH